jgi:hypothetical protein
VAFAEVNATFTCDPAIDSVPQRISENLSESNAFIFLCHLLSSLLPYFQEDFVEVQIDACLALSLFERNCPWISNEFSSIAQKQQTRALDPAL